MTDQEFLQLLGLIFMLAGAIGIGSWLGKKFEGGGWDD